MHPKWDHVRALSMQSPMCRVEEVYTQLKTMFHTVRLHDALKLLTSCQIPFHVTWLQNAPWHLLVASLV